MGPPLSPTCTTCASQRTGYQRHRLVWTKTRPVTIPIGERRAPAPDNRPSYLRVDSVHQGNQDGLKGVYHINAVDCVTQFEAVATCERISEAYLIPVLEELLHSFPFLIRGFHCDNGSEYINRHVADMLNNLLVEEHQIPLPPQQRQRPGRIKERLDRPQTLRIQPYSATLRSAVVNEFCREQINPYINFHRPCLFPETITDAKGRQRKRKRYPYKLMMTPYEKLKSLPNAEQYLKPGISFQGLDALATAISDNDCAQHLNEARARLFKSFSNRSKSAA